MVFVLDQIRNYQYFNFFLIHLHRNNRWIVQVYHNNSDKSPFPVIGWILRFYRNGDNTEMIKKSCISFCGMATRRMIEEPVEKPVWALEIFPDTILGNMRNDVMYLSRFGLKKIIFRTRYLKFHIFPEPDSPLCSSIDVILPNQSHKI